MISVQVRIVGVDKITLKLATLLWPTRDILQEAGDYAAKEAAREAPRDLGLLARSIVTSVDENEVRVFSPLAYAAPMELGRRAGARMPPPDALEGWAQRHGFSNTFVLARSIARQGIQGRLFMNRAADKLKVHLRVILDKAAARIAAIWGS